MAEMKTWYFIRVCPLQDERSAAAWKRAQVYADTEDGVVEACTRHLEKSSNHQLEWHDAFEIASGAQIESYTEPKDDEEPKNPKRQKQREETAQQRQKRDDRDQALVERAVTVALDRVAASSSGASSSGVMVPLGPSRPKIIGAPAVPIEVRAGTIPVRATELQAAIDSAGRALRAVKEAHRISLAASRSFACEAEAMGQAVANLESILEAAMGE